MQFTINPIGLLYKMKGSGCAYMLTIQAQLDRHDYANYANMIMLPMQTCDDGTSYACRSYTKFEVH